MKTWTIGKRIAAGFTSVIIIAVALGMFAYTRLVTIGGHSDHIAKQSLPAIEQVYRVQKNAKDNFGFIYQHIGSSDKEDMARIEAALSAGSADNSKAYAELDKLLTSEKGRELLDKVKTARAECNRIREQVLVTSRQGTNNVQAYSLARSQFDPALSQYISALDALIDLIRNDTANASASIQSSVATSQTGILIALVLALIVGAGVSLIITRGTSKILNGVASALSDNSSQVASAASQVSSASQTLAQGSGEQAASIEETSASLEELASMTKRNAENAQKANDLAREARAAADKGVADMQAMKTAMAAIKDSSDDIAKIIRTIDEIAFQTNILALNAAVEAARAGEAGMGFAVVADEVRNLAQRSATAAKETAAKIEGAITKTAQGVDISRKVAAALNDIVTKARQVDELASEVAGASREQTQGITQINVAVGEMDKVTQSNAASAEESAAAAQELNAQAEMMKHAVAELLHLVNGGAPATEISPASEPRHAPVKPRLERSAIPMELASQAPGRIIAWDEAKMTTGVQSIDQQHQELIDRINDLHMACLRGTATEELMEQLNFLGSYAQSHFAHEEKVMDEHRCPARGQNKQAHATFLKDYQRLVEMVQANGASTKVAIELKRLLANWLSSHICRVDTNLRACAPSVHGQF